MKTKISRRRLMQGASGAGIALLSGCCSYAPRISYDDLKDVSFRLLPQVEASHRVFDKPLRLIMDAHVHIFNASDVQAGGYLSGPVANDMPRWKPLLQILAPIVDFLSRQLAPSAHHELFHLMKQQQDNRSLDKRSQLNFIDEQIERHHRKVADELYQALKPTNFAREYFDLVHQIEPASLEKRDLFSPELLLKAFDRGQQPMFDPLREDNEFFLSSTEAKREHPDGLLAFVANMLSYRYHNIRKYQRAFTNSPSSIGIDACLASMVDFDYWVGDCDHAHSRLRDQMLLMQQLVKVSDGFILPLFGYNPWNDIKNHDESLNLLKMAVTEYGFVGAKIYPPIGFRPLNNKESYYEEDQPFPDVQQLNQKLTQFYRECKALDIPIMAHGNHSKGRDETHRNFAGPEAWAEVFAHPEFDGLRVNIGHFGGNYTTGNTNWTEGFAELMQSDSARNLYGDIGFWDELQHINSQEALLLRKIKHQSVSNNQQVVDRLLFGTDWHMLSQVDNWSDYPARVFLSLKQQSGLTDEELTKVYSTNVLNLFGFHQEPAKQGKNHSRLKAYYQKHNVNARWLNLVEQQSAD
ncbi:amidohydrolase family protein [Pleionea sp. CnH1-48]|uniref:amidohydrolase family protein n=1 Tax=Pleionea sp. CnH1-48 TaxID=2954494 RepID=UPI002097FAB0|nr:amidohydrolase family protein [Pleionea sp. CnH1-48]MCO7224150.1 amidohydrolase [Pleionea sp. CnH1-48]